MSKKIFICPAIKDPWNAECKVFAKGKHFCPYAPMAVLKERYELPDCPHAHELMWKHYQNYEQRMEYLKNNPLPW